MVDTVFKTGDRVVCTRSASALHAGEQFTVTEAYEGLVGDPVVDLIDDQGRRIGYAHASRFKKVFDPKDQINLIDTGMAYKLQGSYGRMADALINSGDCWRA